MLDHIDDIPWSKLGHAYGPADDVPGLIRKLASSDAETRREALTELYSNIWHQGTVYEATAYAVPFIIELLREPSVLDKQWLLVLLSDLAKGSSYWNTHQQLSIFNDSKQDHQSDIEKELGWVRAARDAVLEGRSLYVELLHSSDDNIRMAAASLLGDFREMPKAAVEDLRLAYAAQKNIVVRTAQVLAIGSLGLIEQSAIPLLVATLNSDKARAVQVAAARGLASISARFAISSEADSRSLALLSEIVEYPNDVSQVFKSMPDEADIATTCCSALLVLVGNGDTATQTSRIAKVLPSLIAALGRATPYKTLDIAESLFKVVFMGRPMPESATSDTLTSEQRAALQAILDSNKFWGADEKDKIWVNRAKVMREFGLPERRKKLRAFLRGELSPADKDWKGV